MEWSFQQPGGGVVTVREEGETAVCQALLGRAQGGGLWKAWLRGGGGEVLLGTLIPEGGSLRLRRTVPVEQLRRQGAWPPAGAVLTQRSPERGQDTERGAPAGWTRCRNGAEELEGERAVRELLRQAGGCLLQRQAGRTWLAWPWEEGGAFPVPELFCFFTLRELAGRSYLLLCLDERGRPTLEGGAGDCG